MARGTQHRKRRPAQDARKAALTAGSVQRPRKQKPPQWQEELFFQRLRVHAKWAFVLLALVFAVGFVFFGVGSGSSGISDALQNAFNFGGSGSTPISKLQAKTDKNPANAQAWRDLATALEQKQRTAEAVTALERYTALRPKDSNALAELAGEYTTLAEEYARDYTAAQSQAAAATPPSAAFAPDPKTPFGKVYSSTTALKDPIAGAVQALASEKQNTAYSNYQGAQRNAEGAYQKLAKLNPNDATTQIQLGEAAQAAQDTATAIAAYTKFLKLAPSDPSAGQIRQQLKALKAQAAVTPSK